MLADRLKTETLANHQQLEKLLVSRMKSIRSKTDYVNLLQLFHSYFGGLEVLITPYINVDNLPDYAIRRKSEALIQDIADLGGTPAQKANTDDLPVIDNATKAFAALYVIEGSTLGGKIISKMMAQQLGISDGRGLKFFNGYGDNSDHMWLAFKDYLNRQAATVAHEDVMIDTANKTFALFKTWIDKNNY